MDDSRDPLLPSEHAPPVTDDLQTASAPTVAPATRQPTGLWRRLFWVCLVAAVICGLPPFLQRVQYALTYGRASAEAEIARRELQLNEVSYNSLSHAFRLVAKSVSPSVVRIRTLTESKLAERLRRMPPSGHPPISQDDDPNVLRQEGEGSGVVVDNEGYIVTNDHVIQNADIIEVYFHDGRRETASVIGEDEEADLAVIKVESDNLIPAPWGDSEQLKVGDFVWAIGSPFGLQHSLTFGIVSAKGRRDNNFGHYPTFSPFKDYLQTDAAVNPGNSGGPLVNIRGEIVGINTAVLGQSYQGISFAIPSEVARRVYESIREFGYVRRGWFGVAMGRPWQDFLKATDETRGVRVTGVTSGSPAELAGIQAGDTIVRWDQFPIQKNSDLSLAVADTSIGSQVNVEYLRDGAAHTTTVTVGDRASEMHNVPLR